MACMCGDYCCPSCGPAQGNWRCPICGEWASEVCEHIDEDTNQLKPEFVAEAERLARLEWEELERQRLAEEQWLKEHPEHW